MSRKARWFKRSKYGVSLAAERLLESAHGLGHAPQLCTGWHERIPRVRELYACWLCNARAVIDCGPARGPLVMYGCRKENTQELQHAD